MSMKTVTFEVSEESLATLDEIAANMEIDRATVLRDALAFYLADYETEKAEVEEAERQVEAGNFKTQDEIEALFEARFQRPKAA
jgi:predicted transcriptional regulator